MFEVNVAIISELKAFLHNCASDPALLSALRNNDTAFTRNRKLSFERLILFICKLCKETSSVALDKFFFSDLDLNYTCTPGALSQQRKKLSFCFFTLWNEVLCGSFYHYARIQNKIRTWHNYRIIAADGSYISLIGTTTLHKHFGGQRNQQGLFSGAKAFFHYDVLNNLFTHSRLGPYRTPEPDMAHAAIDLLGSDTIAVYDRNFSSYKTIALHLWAENAPKFVIRAKESLNLVRRFLKSGLISEVIALYPPGKDAIKGMRKAGFVIMAGTSLRVRMVKVKLDSGATEVLFTNLWEEEGFGAELFKELYFLRWGIETAIGRTKNLLQIESLSGLSVESVYQDFYATVFMSNLSSLLSCGAQEEHRNLEHKRSVSRSKWPLKVNMNKASGRLRTIVAVLFMSPEPELILNTLTAYFLRHMLPVRKGRSFVRKRKNKQSFSKHKTFSNYKLAY